MIYEGWHFSNGRLAYGDNREIVRGGVYEARPQLPKDALRLCEAGLLHASARATDALRYAPFRAATVTYVRLAGDGLIESDKAGGTVRTVLYGPADARQALLLFARMCAERAGRYAYSVEHRLAAGGVASILIGYAANAVHYAARAVSEVARVARTAADAVCLACIATTTAYHTADAAAAAASAGGANSGAAVRRERAVQEEELSWLLALAIQEAEEGAKP